MADAARRMGWNWLGIADHSPTLQIANGASADDLIAQHNTMQKYNAEWKNEGVDFRLFSGVESDILKMENWTIPMMFFLKSTMLLLAYTP